MIRAIFNQVRRRLKRGGSNELRRTLLDPLLEVALAPEEEGYGKEVLYGLDLKSKRGLDLVLLVNGQEAEKVLSVTTRSEARNTSQS